MAPTKPLCEPKNRNHDTLILIHCTESRHSITLNMFKNVHPPRRVPTTVLMKLTSPGIELGALETCPPLQSRLQRSGTETKISMPYQINELLSNSKFLNLILMMLRKQKVYDNKETVTVIELGEDSGSNGFNVDW